MSQPLSDNRYLLDYAIWWICNITTVRKLYSSYLMTHQLMDTYYHTTGTDMKQ